MNHHTIYCILWFSLAVICWKFRVGTVWLLFFALAAYQCYRAARGDRAVAPTEELKFFDEEPVGQLGHFVVDDTDSFGLYMNLDKNRIFVDIRQDKKFEERKAHALNLYAHSKDLDESFESFCARNPEYKQKRVVYLGLHSKDLDQAEVFWEPEGYTLLRGLEFVES